MKKTPNKKTKNNFCCRSCATQFNNKLRKHSVETKEKIRASIVKYHQEHPEEFKNFIKSGQRSNLNRSKNYDLALEHLRHDKHKICPTCGKNFIARRWSTIYCSSKCVHNSLEYKDKLRQTQLEKVKNKDYILDDKPVI